MDASLTKDGSRYTLRFERRLAHSPKKVWRVLTERDQLKKWHQDDRKAKGYDPPRPLIWVQIG